MACKKIELLELALAEYIEKYGLTDQAREAMIFKSPHAPQVQSFSEPTELPPQIRTVT